MEAATSFDVPVLPARGPEDLLAYAGHALGRLPEGSLVLVTLRRGRLRAVVRVDLPARQADTMTWAGAVAAVCRRDAGADGTLCLALPAGPDAGLAPPSWAAALAEALVSAGRPPAGAWTCAHGRARPWWGSGAAEEGPLDPRAAPLSLHLMSRGSVWDRAAAPEAIPRRGPAAARPEDPRWRLPAQDAPRARRAWLARWEPVLAGETSVADGPGPVVLGPPLARPAWRDALLVHAARPPGADPGDRADRESILTAATDRAPAWGRLDALRTGLRAIVPAATPAAAAQALALCGWIGWARGHGSDAAAHLAAAGSLTPHDPFVSVLGRIVAAGYVAGWATDPAMAWRPDGGGP